MRNRELKKTLHKLEDNPNYQFHSEWHRDRHFQARQDKADQDRIFDIWGVVLALVALPFVIMLCFGG